MCHPKCIYTTATCCASAASNIDGKAGGGYDKFVLSVDASDLGRRPPPAAAAEAPAEAAAEPETGGVQAATLRATATCKKFGRALALLTVEVHDDQRRLVASGRVLYALATAAAGAGQSHL